MTLTIVPKDAEALLTWPGLLDAFEAGHRLPKPDIKDLFVYRGPDTVLDRATWIDGLGALVKVATVIPSNAQRGLPTVNGSVTLYDDTTGELTALVDFHLVTKWKTAGDSLLSARRLARAGLCLDCLREKRVRTTAGHDPGQPAPPVRRVDRGPARL